MRKFLVFILSLLLLVLFSPSNLNDSAMAASTCSYSVTSTVKEGEKIKITALGRPGEIRVSVGSLPSVTTTLDSGDPIDIEVAVPGLKAGQTYNVNVTPTFRDAIPCDKDGNTRVLVISATSSTSGSTDGTGGGYSGYEILAHDFATPMSITTQEANNYLYGNVYGIPTGEASVRHVVTEHTKTVEMRFKGLTPGQDYDICLSTACLLIAEGVNDFDKLSDVDLDIKTDKEPADGSGMLRLYLCADGGDHLKLADGTECGEGDYFHGRSLYAVLIGTKEGLIDTAPFYVAMYYPKVEVYQTENHLSQIKPGKSITVQLKGTKPPHDKGKRNNYAVEFAGASNPGRIFKQHCITIPNKEPDHDGSTSVDFSGRPIGDYIIKVNEQANEGGLLVGRGGCSAEFTYYWIRLRIRDDAYWQKNKSHTSIIEIIPDPNGSDVAGANRNPKGPLPPCGKSEPWDPTSGNPCPALKTGLGIDIATAPEKFIGSIFGVVLGLSGGLALLLIIYGGYQLMASRGKPETMEAARDQITAAIIGLLFIIFALVILQVIGVDILQIPGFNP